MEIKLDREAQIELMGLELIDFRKRKQKYIKTCDQMIEYYKNLKNNAEIEIGAKEQQVTTQVLQLAQDLEWHETKTLRTYELPSISLKITKEKKDIALKDNYNEAEIPDEYINVKRYVNWQKFKNQCQIANESVIYNETGEILSSVEIISKPEKFEIKQKW